MFTQKRKNSQICQKRITVFFLLTSADEYRERIGDLSRVYMDYLSNSILPLPLDDVDIYGISVFI